MDENERIEQFRKMAQANPEDDLAHFALGQALFDADRFGEAVNVLKHVIKVNSGYSRAYVLLGHSQMELDDETGAVETYQRGYAAAMSRGDLMPATEMKQKLSDLGESIDAISSWRWLLNLPSQKMIANPVKVKSDVLETSGSVSAWTWTHSGMP